LDAVVDEGGRVGVAVSGGGDSVALLHLAKDWAQHRGTTIFAATVDHGLRPEAAAEAAAVSQVCGMLGISHDVLHWRDWDGQGNLQAKARDARRRLLSGWVKANGLTAVLLGHTADDQAETVVMRLARGSGVDGLCGMDCASRDGVFLRPLLGISRAQLRDWLRARDITWIEDPSNDDPRFDRVRARRMLADLAPLGLTAARLTETAAHMARARATLRRAAADWTAAHVRAEGGDLVFDAESLHLDRSDTEGRVLAAAVQWIGSAPYRPRHEALTDAATAVLRGDVRTLGGVRMQPEADGRVRLMREAAAAAGPIPMIAAPEAGMVWDGRWLVTCKGEAAHDARFALGALGETGLAACAAWRGAGLPRASLLSTPAVWSGERLVAAPLAGFANGWQARLCLPFDRFILSH